MNAHNVMKLMLLGSALTLISTLASAQQANIGQREFEANCAVCHGISGKGDGPLSGYLTQKVADLTVLAKKNNGVFPFNEVYETIDGRRAVKGHGTRDMPAWGDEYDVKSRSYFMDYRAPYDVESFIRGRILALTAYIFQIQAK